MYLPDSELLIVWCLGTWPDSFPFHHDSYRDFLLCCTRRTIPSTSALHLLLDALEHSAAIAVQLESDLPPARPSAGPPGAPPDPSLTQADRFLLVFRVCFCLAPFEIGYDVGGKAAASKPHANSGERPPVVSWKKDGQRVGKDDLALCSLTSLAASMIPYCRGKREHNVFFKKQMATMYLISWVAFCWNVLYVL